MFALECIPQKYNASLDTKYYYHYWLKEPDPKKLTQYLRNLHKWRSSFYGRVNGEGVTYPYNRKDVTTFLQETTFMGIKVRMHKRVIKPLACVEIEIIKNCQDNGNAYIPQAISGYRSGKSYKRVISNHRFGIAIDFDPLADHSHNDGNPCCGPSCKKQWREHPICKNHDTSHHSPYNVAKVNPCWVQAFEKYGFHWLINYRMHDTMHFEYLGDPTHWERF